MVEQDKNITDLPLFQVQSDDERIHPLFKITPDEYERMSPLLRACANLAARAHANDPPRQKEGIEIPYIHHVIGAMHVLEAVGVHNQVTLATALLHDALEQGAYHFEEVEVPQEVSDWLGNPHSVFEAQLEKARQNLSKLIETETKKELGGGSFYEAGQNAQMISACVANLTNAPKSHDKSEHKRFKQARKIERFGKVEKRVKMADLISSFIDDLLYGRKSGKEHPALFYNRGMTVADLCKDAHPKLFGLAYNLAAANTDVIAGKLPPPDVQGFHLKNYQDVDKKHAHNMDWEKRRYAPLQWVDAACFGQVKHGVLSVALGDRKHPHASEAAPSEAMVTAFRVKDDLGGVEFQDTGQKINQTKSELANALGIEQRVIVTPGVTGQYAHPNAPDDAAMAIKITLKPAVPVEKFLEIAQQVKAISPELVEQVRQQAQHIAPTSPRVAAAEHVGKVKEPQGLPKRQPL